MTVTKLIHEKKLSEQLKLCDELHSPLWMPKDGICLFCYENIFDMKPEHYFREHLITGCPKCMHSFVE